MTNQFQQAKYNNQKGTKSVVTQKNMRSKSKIKTSNLFRQLKSYKTMKILQMKIGANRRYFDI
jgi:hypothetical protein